MIQVVEELRVLGALEQVNGWLARGDGIAVYEAQAFDRSDFGTRQYVSFGSSAAQLETDDPPAQLPDIGGQINWPYRLVASYRGEPLSASGNPGEPPREAA